MVGFLVVSVGEGEGILLSFLEFQHGPVKDVIKGVALAVEQLSEKITEVAVVGLVSETKRSDVVQVLDKLSRIVLAEQFGGGSDLLVTNLFVLLLLCSSLESLPRQRPTQEVHEDIADALQIVSSTLLHPKMCVDACVSGSSCEVLVLTVLDVLVCLGITVLFGKTKIDGIDRVCLATKSNEEVVWLDVTMNEVLGVDVLDTAQQLLGNHQDGLQAELARAKVEQVLQTGSQEVHDHHIVVSFHTKVANVGDSNSTTQYPVEFGFVHELGMLGLDGLELDRNLFAGGNIRPEEDVTE